MTSSTSHWPLSALEDQSADLIEPVRRRLAWWCTHPAAHARFLNTLSLLEHIGSRKIMVSQERGPLGGETLRHLAEEARHAWFFKRQAERLAERPLAYGPDETLAASSARMYFGRLDLAVNQQLPAERLAEIPYLYVSLTIELRAIWTYRMYQEVLAEHQTGVSLRTVLGEEERHLEDMVARLTELNAGVDALIPVFVAVEDRLFRAFWANLDAAAKDVAVAA